MSFNAPKSPDPTATSNTQMQYNTDAAKTQQGLNSFNQGSNYGTISYVADPSSPSGYRLQTSLSPEQQALYNKYTGNQSMFGSAAPGLISKGAADLTAPMNLDNSAVTKQLNSWQQAYQQPLFDQQSSNLEAQLRNQGLTPGSPAYNNAKNLLARNQGDVTNQYLTMNQGQSFDQALKAFQAQQQQGSAEAQLGGSLFGASAPQGPTQMNTPTSQIQPPNYSGQVQQNYQNEMQNYQNTWNNVGKLAGAGVSLAMAPMTGGASLAGGIGSMFGSSPTGSPGYGNFGQYSPYSPMNSA